MKVVIVGYGTQGKKRYRIAKKNIIGIVDPNIDKIKYKKLSVINISTYDSVLLCVPDNQKINLEISSREKECLLSADSEIFSIAVRTKLSINKSKHKLKLIDTGNLDPLNTLREKLLWGKDKRTEQ